MLPCLLLIYWYTDNPSMWKFGGFVFLSVSPVLFVKMCLLKSHLQRQIIFHFTNSLKLCAYSPEWEYSCFKYHLFGKSLIFTTFTSIDFSFHKCASFTLWNMHESLHIFSLIWWFLTPYIHIQGKQLSYSLLLSFP